MAARKSLKVALYIHCLPCIMYGGVWRRSDWFFFLIFFKSAGLLALQRSMNVNGEMQVMWEGAFATYCKIFFKNFL